MSQLGRRTVALIALFLLVAPAAAQDAAVPDPDPPPAEAAPARPKPRPKPKSSKPPPAPSNDASRAGADVTPNKSNSGTADTKKPDLSTLDLSTGETSRPEASRVDPGKTGTGREAIRPGSASQSGNGSTPQAGKPEGRTRQAPAAASGSDAGKGGTLLPEIKPATTTEAKTPFAPPPGPTEPVAPVPRPAQGAIVACDPGQAILYDEPNGFSFWVTRSGTVTINNPLRPLTPDVTRVLQLVIAGKLATVYGPDLTVLRRGGAPGALEGLLGGPIRWDATLGTLPDSLDIVADSGAPLALMRFKECGAAPAVKAPAPVAGKDRKGRERKAGADPAAPAAGGAVDAGPAQAGGAAPRRFTLPQGAIPE